jgi:hypothetical protein
MGDNISDKIYLFLFKALNDWSHPNETNNESKFDKKCVWILTNLLKIYNITD